MGVSGELGAPAGAGAVVQTAESAQADKAAGAGAEAQESLRVSRSLRASRSVPSQKRSHVSFSSTPRGTAGGGQKWGGNLADEIEPPTRREVKHEVAPTPDSSSHTHAHASTPRRHNHGADRTQGADRRRAAAGASLSVPLVTRPLTHATERLLAPLRRMMERSRSRTCSSRSCSSTVWPQARPAPRSHRPAPRRER